MEDPPGLLVAKPAGAGSALAIGGGDRVAANHHGRRLTW